LSASIDFSTQKPSNEGIWAQLPPVILSRVPSETSSVMGSPTYTVRRLGTADSTRLPSIGTCPPAVPPACCGAGAAWPCGALTTVMSIGWL